MGGAGISGGTSGGTLRVISALPAPHCTPAHTENRPTIRTEQRPWAFDQPQAYRFSTSFPTGSATLTPAGLQDLELFVAHIMAEYDRGGMNPPGQNQSR